MRMKVSEEEAVDLLHKWQAENRVIHCTVGTNGVVAKVLGRIDTMENKGVHLSAAKSTMPLGEANFVEFPLSDSVCEYADAEDVPEPLAGKLKGYDSILSVVRLNVSVVLAVLPPLDELAI